MQRIEKRQAPSVKAMRMQAMVTKGWRIIYGRPDGILLRIESDHAVIDRDGNLQVGTGAGVLFIASEDAQGFDEWIGCIAPGDAVSVPAIQ